MVLKPYLTLNYNCLNKKQKQPPEVFFRKTCSQKLCKVHRKTPVPESFSVTLLKTRLDTGDLL